MTGASASTHFNRAPLVRQLAANTAKMPDAPPDIAVPLAGWLNFTQAIALHGALSADAPKRKRVKTEELRRVAQTLREEAGRLRELLLVPLMPEGAQTRSPTLRSRHRWPVAGDSEASDFLPYRRFILALERDMDVQIASLRALIRQQISPLSSQLKRLAAIDETLEQVLAEPARDGLSGIAHRLEKRFRDGLSKDPVALAQQVKNTLRAELEFRVLPVEGLLDALDQEIANA